MSKSTITIGLVGDMNGAIAGSLKDHIQLAPFSGSLQALSGVLWDGQSASGSSADQQAFQSVLESGKTLALANPTAQQLASVREITGCGPSEPVALITYTRSKSGPSPYRCSMMPSGKVTSQAIASDTGAGPVLSSSAAAQLGPAITQTVQSQGSIMAVPGDSSGLVAPIGAIYGYSSFQSSPLNWGATGPFINNHPDDITAQSKTQIAAINTLTEFFVYYVNGQAPPNGNTPPFYIVILRQTGSFTCGLSQSAQNENSRGWFQYENLLTPNNVANAQQQPFSSGVTLLGHAPVSFAGPQVPVALRVPMTVIAKTQSGTGPVQFTATVNDATLLPDWAVADTSSGISTSWNYHEVTAWDPTQKPPNEFHNWWKTMYPSNDKVVELPQLSCAPANLNFEAVTAWSFASSLITPPNSPTSRSLVVSFTGSWDQHLAFLHNIDGCHGADDPMYPSMWQIFRHHHLFWKSNSWQWTWTIDLGKVAVQT